MARFPACLHSCIADGEALPSRVPFSQFGCARHEASVRAALAAYKERFVHSLPAAQQRQCDFGRPVFLAAAFYLVARRNKVAVRQARLVLKGAARGHSVATASIWLLRAVTRTSSPAPPPAPPRRLTAPSCWARWAPPRRSLHRC